MNDRTLHQQPDDSIAAFVDLLATAQRNLKVAIKAAPGDEAKIVAALREELKDYPPEMRDCLIELARMPDIKPPTQG